MLLQVRDSAYLVNLKRKQTQLIRVASLSAETTHGNVACTLAAGHPEKTNASGPKKTENQWLSRKL